MTKPNVYVDPEKAKGQSFYEHAAGGYVGPKPWPLWSELSKAEKRKWARMEKESYGDG